MAPKAKTSDPVVRSRRQSSSEAVPMRRASQADREISDEQFGVLASRIDAMERDLDRLLSELKSVHP